MNESITKWNSIAIMTYNVRCLNNKDTSPHTWKERLPAIKKVIQNQLVDILAVQEADPQQMRDLKAILPGYHSIGVGREGGANGESNAIFFNHKRFSRQDHETCWLSDTPSVAASATWGNSIPRIVTSAKFFDHETNQYFAVLNTHLDHRSAEAREKSAALLLKLAKNVDSGVPIFITGDFNTNKSSSAYQTLVNEGPFHDLWDVACSKENEHLGTLNLFHDASGGGPEQRIDWILAKGSMMVQSIKIINTQFADQFPSDHFPVLTNVILTNFD